MPHGDVAGFYLATPWMSYVSVTFRLASLYNWTPAGVTPLACPHNAVALCCLGSVAARLVSGLVHKAHPSLLLPPLLLLPPHCCYHANVALTPLILELQHVRVRKVAQRYSL
jgi:hypothetical protein